MAGLRGWQMPVTLVLALAIAVGAAYALRPRLEAPTGAAVEPASGLAVLPVAEITLPEGKGKGLVAAYCTMCHSLLPIVRHAGLGKELWAEEVAKMREHYGCTLDEPTAAAIVGYLQAHYSAPAQLAAP